MNEWNDSELREALRRREVQRLRTEVTEDFVNDVMREIEACEHPWRLAASVNRHLWRIALAALAAAASIALVVVWTWSVIQSDTSSYSIGHVQSINRIRPIHQSGTSNPSIGHVQSINRTRPINQSSALSQSTGHVQSVNRTRPIGQSAISNHGIGHAQSAADSLEYYISRVEAQLSKISDSCYETHVERLIRVDDRLSRLVNRIIMDGIIADTLRHTALSE